MKWLENLYWELVMMDWENIIMIALIFGYLCLIGILGTLWWSIFSGA